MRLPFSRVLCFVALLCICSLPVAAQSSTPTSSLPDPLWQTLLEQTQSLPQAIDSYSSSWTAQVQELQQKADSLSTSNAQLTDSNSALQTSNLNLTQQNEDLQTSLQASQAALATSEAARQQLQTALDASTQSITQAQAEAKGLEVQAGFLKVGVVTLGISTAAGAGYIVGHLVFHWW